MDYVPSAPPPIADRLNESWMQSDFLSLGLAYGSLISPLHQMVLGGKIPNAVVIYGPRGVGKRTLCQLVAAQVLGLNPWLTAMLCLKQDLNSHLDPCADIFDATIFQERIAYKNAPKQILGSREIDANEGNPMECHPNENQLNKQFIAEKNLDSGLLNLHAAAVKDPDVFQPSNHAHDSQHNGLDDNRHHNGSFSPLASDHGHAFDLFSHDPKRSGLLQNHGMASHPFGRSISLKRAGELWQDDQVKLAAHPEYIELDPGAGMDEVRSLLQKLSYTRNADTNRIVILPEAQSLSVATMNALLKCIESPPPRTFFFLTASGALSQTLASRCTAYRMAPLHPSVFQQIFNRIQSGSSLDPLISERSAEMVLLFKMTQGCLGRISYWQERMPWVYQGWNLLQKSALGECLIPDDWLKMAQSMGDSVWDFLYIWGRAMYDWAYQQGFFAHWDIFWSAIWALVRDYQIYHTDVLLLWQTIFARIYGFHGRYGVAVMPIEANLG